MNSGEVVEALKNFFAAYTTYDSNGQPMLKIDAASDVNIHITQTSSIIPSEFSQVVADGESAASNFDSTTSDNNGAGYANVSAQIDATGLDDIDATVKLQESSNGTAWVDLSGATVTINPGTGSFIIPLTAFNTRYVRAVYTKNSVAAGTVTITLNFK